MRLLVSVSALALVIGLSSATAQQVQTSTGSTQVAPGGFKEQPNSQIFVTATDANTVARLPSGSVVVIFNIGSNVADVILGTDSSIRVINNEYPINPGTWRAFVVGANKYIAAVGPSGVASLSVEGGSGFPGNAAGGSPNGVSVVPAPGSAQRAAIGAAASGANNDITSLSGLTIPLSIAQGGTGGNDATSLRNSLAVAGNGANSDITSLSGLTTPLSVAQGGTGLTSLSSLRAAIGAAASGANSDITSLTGLTTAVGVTAGGTGSNNASGARTNLSAAALGVNGDITQLTALTTVTVSATSVLALTSTNTTVAAPNGDIIVGAGAAIATNSTKSFLSPPFANGVPTGAPAQNAIPNLVWNDTSGTIDVWSPHASAWVHVTLTTGAN